MEWQRDRRTLMIAAAALACGTSLVACGTEAPEDLSANQGDAVSESDSRDGDMTNGDTHSFCAAIARVEEETRGMTFDTATQYQKLSQLMNEVPEPTGGLPALVESQDALADAVEEMDRYPEDDQERITALLATVAEAETAVSEFRNANCDSSDAPPDTEHEGFDGAEARFTFEDDQGYRYHGMVSVASLAEVIETAPPGLKRIFIGEAFGTITNATPGRNAPAPEVEVVVALPTAGCDGIRCRGEFLLVSYYLLNKTADPLGVDQTVDYVVDRTYSENLDSDLVPESLATDSFYWTVKIVGRDDYVADWYTAGDADPAEAPTFTSRDLNSGD